jgi:hypothetical protein
MSSFRVFRVFRGSLLFGDTLRMGIAKENTSGERYRKGIPFADWSPWNGCKAEFGLVHGGSRRSEGGSNQSP